MSSIWDKPFALLSFVWQHWSTPSQLRAANVVLNPSPIRRPTRMVMGGAWVDVDWVLKPRCSPVNKVSDPPKNRFKIGEKSGKGYIDPIYIHNRYAPLADVDMEVEASRLAKPQSLDREVLPWPTHNGGIVGTVEDSWIKRQLWGTMFFS